VLGKGIEMDSDVGGRIIDAHQQPSLSAAICGVVCGVATIEPSG
jgi:hypothetical protein